MILRTSIHFVWITQNYSTETFK